MQDGTCGGEVPAHASRTAGPTFTQRWSGSRWVPASLSDRHGDSRCGFACDAGYSWDGNAVAGTCVAD